MTKHPSFDRIVKRTTPRGSYFHQSQEGQAAAERRPTEPSHYKTGRYFSHSRFHLVLKP